MRPRRFIKGDVEYEFEFSIAKALQLEKDQGINVLKDIEKLAEEPSLTLINNASLVWLGITLEEAYDGGLVMQEVIALVSSMITGEPIVSGTITSVGAGSGFTNPSAPTQPTGSQDGTSSAEEPSTDAPVLPEE